MAKRLDFLNNNEELVNWYGEGFTWIRNPFMLAVSLDERPRTPRTATRKVIVNGKEVYQVSSRLAKQREEDDRQVRIAWERIQASPTWWPFCDEDMWYRVRNAESAILKEERENNAAKQIFLKTE